jgi:hypothetical protein
MFEIKPSSEFSAWFESLSPEVAEEVACALDLLAGAGTALGPSHASRALLWYDGVGDGVPPHFDRNYRAIEQGLSRAAFEARELLSWQREVLRCLDSERFRERLAQLEPKAASLALTAVESLKQQLSAARLRIGFDGRGVPVLRGSQGGLTAGGGALLEPNSAVPEPTLSDSLRPGFFEVLRLVGLEPTQMMNSESGLCELTIAGTEPRVHVLFGLDVAAQCIVVLVGEALTRAYYGDSVMLAEQRWREYRASSAPELAVR